MTLSSYNFPTHVVSGPGAQQALAGTLKAHGVQKVLLVTDQGVVQLPFFQALAASLSASFAVQTFSGIAGNPLISHVTAGVGVARAQ